jgi:hypothetical protein
MRACRFLCPRYYVAPARFIWPHRNIGDGLFSDCRIGLNTGAFDQEC